MYKSIAVVLIGSLLVGCASNPNALTSEQKMAIYEKHMAKNTLEIECPSGGCKVTYRDPRDQLAIPKETNGYDLANTALQATVGIATAVVPWIAVGNIATTAIKHSGNNTSYNNSYNQDSTATPTVVNQPTPTVVNQPDPVIVDQPAPIVVDQPAPIIVQPEVVNPVVVTP